MSEPNFMLNLISLKNKSLLKINKINDLLKYIIFNHIISTLNIWQH